MNTQRILAILSDLSPEVEFHPATLRPVAIWVRIELPAPGVGDGAEGETDGAATRW